MLAELKEKHALLSSFVEKMDADPRLVPLDKKYRDVLFVLAQNLYFSEDEGMSVTDLTNIMKKSDKTIRTMLQKLLEQDMLVAVGNRPIVYSISAAFFD